MTQNVRHVLDRIQINVYSAFHQPFTIYMENANVARTGKETPVLYMAEYVMLNVKFVWGHTQLVARLVLQMLL